MVIVVDFYTSEVAEEDPPIKTVFNIGNEVIAYSKLDDVSKGGVIKMKWYNEGNYKFSTSWTIPEDWISVWTTHPYILQSGESGNWSVKLYYNDVYLKTTYFTVNPPLSSVIKHKFAKDDGKVVWAGNYFYWHEGMPDWKPLTTSVTVPSYTEIYILVVWRNDSSATLKGHVDLSVRYPDGSMTALNDISGQDASADPGDGHMVKFKFTTTMGEHGLYVDTYETPEPLPATIKPYGGIDDGKVVFNNYYYWYEGLSDWVPFTSSVSVPENTPIHILVVWRNDSSETLKGHAELFVLYPDGSEVELNAVGGQDMPADPGNGHMVEFEPFTTTSGDHWVMAKTYETQPDKIIVDVENTGPEGYFTVGVSTTSTITGSDCNLSGNVLEDLPTQYIHLNINETKELTFNLTNTYSGVVYAISKIYAGDSTQQEDCLDGEYGTYIF